MAAEERKIVGRVLRASTIGFDCGTHSSQIDRQHDFGALVKAPVANSPGLTVFGLIFAVEIESDELITELVMAEGIHITTLLDQRNNRMVPVTVRILNVGFSDNGYIVHSLPPRPPLSLSDVEPCTTEEIRAFNERCDYFRLVLNASEVPSDDLLASSLRYAMWTFPDDQQRYDFMVRSGRHISRLLSADLKRLSHVLALIRP
ncbi:MAG: hypothetical protein CL610_24160 [Anaerolineaceae bacterium]|nr:hypothetical protein [Anaerolineaceae bacterium]